MKIVVLDGYTLNPGDLDWKALEDLGELTVYERSSQDQVVERAADADILFTNKTIVTEQAMSKMSKLRYIGVLATGVNIVDLKYAIQNNITVTNIPNYTGLSAAQMVFALLLELTNRIGHHSDTVVKGKWSKSEDFCYWDYPLVELDGLTIGIVGFGGIGKAVARIAQAFGMKVMIHTRRIPENLPEGIEHAQLDSLIASSDVITLHCPLTPQTEGMINRESISRMKRNAYLINISRGALVNEKDLAEALNSNLIAGAALDVLIEEPPIHGSPLFGAKNCFITPHIAWASYASRKRLMSIAVDNLTSYLNGNPKNTVGQK